jgi:GNAT superfamily N-acetyltransferase
MLIEFDVAKADDQFHQILHLQQQNHINALSQAQQAAEGFVFAEHTLDILKAMATHLPQVIALHDGQVIGYNLAMTASMKDVIPSLTPMFEEFKRCEYKGRSLKDIPFIVGGQVCVAKAYRGMGLLKKLYHATKDQVPESYQLCVTEIAANNVVSIHAHHKMGFETIHQYQSFGTQWDIVAWGAC